MEVHGVKSFDNSVGKWEITKYVVTNGSYKYEMTTAKVQRKLCLMSSSKHIMDFVLFLITKIYTDEFVVRWAKPKIPKYKKWFHELITIEHNWKHLNWLNDNLIKIIQLNYMKVNYFCKSEFKLNTCALFSIHVCVCVNVIAFSHHHNILWKFIFLSL